MSAAAESLKNDSTSETALAQEVGYVGVVTRAVSWGLDAAVINLVAVIVGIGAALVLSIFPLGNNLKTPMEAIAGGAYVIWAALYFVVFWSITGQTPGARLMQIRLVTANRGRVKPPRALVRWAGMNLAMLTLFLGYVPILFGRRGLPDWLAKTLVLQAPQMSLAEARLASLRTAQAARPEPDAPVRGDGRAPGAGVREPSAREPR